MTAASLRILPKGKRLRRTSGIRFDETNAPSFRSPVFGRASTLVGTGNTDGGSKLPKRNFKLVVLTIRVNTLYVTLVLYFADGSKAIDAANSRDVQSFVEFRACANTGSLTGVSTIDCVRL